MRRGGIKDDSHDLACGILGLHAIRSKLVIASMPFILLAVAQHVPMQLQNQRLAHAHFSAVLENRLQHLQITSDLLLVASAEFRDAQLAI